jgi:signal transduction histidine kinase
MSPVAYEVLSRRGPRGDPRRHGLLPEVLTRGGLAAGLESIVEGLRVPVQLSVPKDRFPAPIESSAYFIVAEALANMARHSGAQRASVGVKVKDGVLRIDVCDDGVGRARPDGRGLVGLRDRAVTLGGDLEFDSPPAAGTRIAVRLPLRR